jgi:hypothetical protein
MHEFWQTESEMVKFFLCSSAAPLAVCRFAYFHWQTILPEVLYSFTYKISLLKISDLHEQNAVCHLQDYFTSECQNRFY